MLHTLKNSFSRLLLIAVAVAASLLGTACSIGTRITAVTAQPSDASGTYSLYLYGCRYADDVENMALLVDESAPYRIDLFVPDTGYRVKKGLSGRTAFAKAEAFVRCGIHDLWMTAFRKVADPSGRTIAFEVKPLYVPNDVGTDEALISSYVLRDDTVTVYLRLDPAVERRLHLPNFQGGGN